MHAMKKTSSSSFDEDTLSSLVSVRGPLLTFRKRSHLWVLRAGLDPRAWTLKLDAQGEGVGVWKHARPDVDAWLRAPEHFLGAREKLRRELRACVARHMEPQCHAAPEEMHARRECLRRLIKLDRLMQWTLCFPREAFEFLERHRFQSRRWHLLNLWLRVPEGRELFDDVPALAWLAASSWCFKTNPVQRPLRSLRSLVRKPRRHLLRWLDLPEGDGIIRLLRTVKPADMDPMQAEAVCRVLRDEPRRRWWQSLAQPTEAQVVHLLAYQTAISFPLLRSISERRSVGTNGNAMKVEKVFHDTMRMLHVLGRAEHRDTIARIESPERLLEEHDRLARDFARLRAAPELTGSRLRLSGLTKDVPPPLLPPPWMRPITNLNDLLLEGAEMHHCIAGYECQIAARTYYAYAVHHPQGRATLGLYRINDRTWAVSELRGPHNATVPRAIHTAVTDWLRKSVPSDAFILDEETAEPDDEGLDEQLWFDLDDDEDQEERNIHAVMLQPAGADDDEEDGIPF